MSRKRKASEDAQSADDEHLAKRSERDVSEAANQSSLQELATRKAFGEILHPSFRDSDFEALEPRLQRLLFSKLRSEFLCLRQSTLYLNRRIPEADRYLYTPAAKTRSSLIEKLETSNGPTVRESLVEKWRYMPIGYFRENLHLYSTNQFRKVHWDESALSYDHKQPEIQFTLGITSLRNRGILRPPPHLERPWRLRHRISSQLLQYRIRTTFETQPPEDGHDPFCYDISFLHQDGRSIFTISDCEGAPGCHFAGDEEAGRDALSLLNYLCGSDVAHPYAFCLAGTAAEDSEDEPLESESAEEDLAPLA